MGNCELKDPRAVSNTLQYVYKLLDEVTSSVELEKCPMLALRFLNLTERLKKSRPVVVDSLVTSTDEQKQRKVQFFETLKSITKEAMNEALQFGEIRFSKEGKPLGLINVSDRGKFRDSFVAYIQQKGEPLRISDLVIVWRHFVRRNFSAHFLFFRRENWHKIWQNSKK